MAACAPGQPGMSARIISERDITPGRGSGCDRFDGVLENQQWVSPTMNCTADASLYVSAHDMARWSIVVDSDSALTHCHEGGHVGRSTLNSGEHRDYGFGWRLFFLGGSSRDSALNYPTPPTRNSGIGHHRPFFNAGFSEY